MFLLLLLPEISPPCQLFSFQDQKILSSQNCPPILPLFHLLLKPFFPLNFSLFSFSPWTKHVCTKFAFQYDVSPPSPLNRNTPSPLNCSLLVHLAPPVHLVHYFNRLVPFAELPQTFPPWKRLFILGEEANAGG